MPTSTKELESLVTQAQEATKSLEGELRRVAFERVLDHLLGSCPSLSVAPPVRQEPLREPRTVQDSADGILAGEQQRIDALARYFKVDPDDVGHIFNTSAEEPGLEIATKHLPEPKAQATREIALLVTGALTALGMETTTSRIKDVTDEYGKYDSSNFMSTLTNLHEISVLGKPRSSNRIVRMKVAGAEEARSIAERILG